MDIDDICLHMRADSDKLNIKYYDLENYMKGNIYHYTNIISLENIIKSKSLWITKSNFLNDKTEYLYAIKLINKIYSNHNYSNLYPNSMNDIMKKLKSELNRSFIFSSSINKDSVNLWSNYSKFEGYSINFNLREIFNKMWDEKIFVTGNKKDKHGNYTKYKIQRKGQYKTVIMSPGKVVYDMNQQEEIIEELLAYIDKIYGNYYDFYNKIDDYDAQAEKNTAYFDHTCTSIINKTINLLSANIQLFKNPIFMQDEEYRIIFDINSKLDVIKYRVSNGIFVPYIEVTFEDTKEKGEKILPIDGITIGPKNNLDIALKGLELFLKKQGYNVTSNSLKNNQNRILLSRSKVPLRY